MAYLEMNEEIGYLFNKGQLYHAYRHFGAHVVKNETENGTHFALWAPNAAAVTVVGDWNDWSGEDGAMTALGSSGIWQCHIADVDVGAVYKYKITTADKRTLYKADPFAFAAEMRPGNASMVTTLSNYSWRDKGWCKRRQQASFRERPFNVYEVHAGSWLRHEDGSFLNYRELADELIPYVEEMGYTHIEFMPLAEHPFDGSWGYQITGYYAATSRYGAPSDLMYLIDQCHRNNLGVILDWVPGHFCSDEHGLIDFDGSQLYGQEIHVDWGTCKFDFSRPEVSSFLISNANFWFNVYHIDGLRVDGVSSMLYLNYGEPHRKRLNKLGGDGNLEAIEFLKQLNHVVLSEHPGVLMIAEESTAWPLVTYPPEDGGLGFHYKWNMGWMNDTLIYTACPFRWREKEHSLLTFSMMYAFSENYILPLSHDEVVHGKKSLIEKMSGEDDEKFAGLRLLYAYQMCHPGAKLSFMGNEFGQFVEWNFDSALEWFLLDYDSHRQLQTFVKTLNQLYCKERAFWEVDDSWAGFSWLDADDSKQSILLFNRYSAPQLNKLGTAELQNVLVVLLNFQPVSYQEFKIGVDSPVTFREILNSDDVAFGGHGLVNNGPLKAAPEPYHGRPCSLTIQLPPLSAVILRGRMKKALGE